MRTEAEVNCIMTVLGFFALVIILFLTRNRWKHVKHAWQKLATQTGLSYEPSGWPEWLGLVGRVTGVYQGRALELRMVWEGSSTHSRSIRVTVPVSNKANIYFLQRRDTPSFKPRFVTKCQPENFITKLPSSLSKKLEATLMIGSKASIQLKDQELRFQQETDLDNTSHLQYIFGLLCEVAEAVERQSERLLQKEARAA